MATTLTLFPSRIRFVNADGTLTPEAYRALQVLVERSGGILGDNGVDVFGDFGDLNGSSSQDSSFTDTVVQATEVDQLADMVQQLAQIETFAPDVIQPLTDKSMTLPEAVTVGASPYSYTARRDGYLAVTGGTVTKQEYGRRGVFTDVGLLTSMLPILQGDTMRVTYTAAPTITFIPR